MADDSNGFNISDVFIPDSGKLFVKAATGQSLSTKSDMINPAWVPGAPYAQAPLFAEDGGPEFSNENDGDPQEFFQSTYQIAAPGFNSTLTLSIAGYKEVIELLRGNTLDNDGYGYVRGGTNPNRLVVLYQGLYRLPEVDGYVIWNREGYAHCTALTETQETRGEYKVFEVELSFSADPSIFGNAYHQAILYPEESV